VTSLAGKTAIVTGASRGIGLAVAKVCPGGVDIDLIKGTGLGERLKGQPMIQPKDIAEMVLFLLRQPANIDLSEVTVRRFDPK